LRINKKSVPDYRKDMAGAILLGEFSELIRVWHCFFGEKKY
jgi:hypothetical protein